MSLNVSIEGVNNGRVDWGSKNGKTLKELQEALAKA